MPLKHAVAMNPEVLPETTPPETEIEYVDISTLETGSVEALSPKPLTFGEAPSRARRVLRSGDTILSTVRTYLRAVATFPRVEGNLVASTGFAVLRPNGTLLPRFAYWAALSEPFVNAIVAHSEGVSYPAISPSVLGALHLPVPPVHEQEHIANFLDEQTARIDALIAEKLRLRELLSEHTNSRLYSLFGTSGATQGSLPKLAYFVSENNAGEVIDKSWWGEGSERLYTCAREPLESNFDSFPADKRTTPRDLLLTRNGTPYVHKPVPGSIYSNVVQRVTISERIDLDFLRNALQVAAWSMKGYGVSIESLNYGMWASLRFPVPNLERQRELTLQAEGLVALAERLQGHLAAHIARLREYRSSLISAAVTGQLDVGVYRSPAAKELAA